MAVLPAESTVRIWYLYVVPAVRPLSDTVTFGRFQKVDDAGAGVDHLAVAQQLVGQQRVVPVPVGL